MLFIVVAVRLFYWQVIASGKLSALAKKQYHSQEEISAERGEILASDEFPLAANQKVYLLFTDLEKFKDEAGKIAKKLAPLLVTDDQLVASESAEKKKEKEQLIKQKEIDLEDSLTNEELDWVALQHKINKDIKEKIEAMEIEGLGFEEEWLRFYPEASMAAGLIGFVGKNEQGKDTGYFGLEGFYDIELKGRGGLLTQQIDAARLPILIGSFTNLEKRDGQDLVLYLDRAVQFIVEDKLREAVEKHDAKSGEVVVLDPQTGGVLAMASYPSFDPNKYYQCEKEIFRNPIVSDAYEPGSTFKIFVMASALDSDAVKEDTKCDICTGPLKIDKYEIKTWNEKYYPDSNMTDVIVHSDNIGMVFVSRKLDRAKFLDYLHNFGFGKKTQIDLQGENPCSLKRENKWSSVDMATASFGQGIAVTAIQVARAASVIANEGNLIEPHVVKKFVSGEEQIEVRPKIIKRVIKEKTAEAIKDMMVKAVEHGESRYLKLKGYKVAGKTGTAQIPVAGHYDEEKTIASFVGFAPADEAKFVMLVKLREPTSSPWGSETAAPLFFDIAKELLIYYGIQPD
jgi:cell division protein FtsI/penicillin-binding protein 2